MKDLTPNILIITTDQQRTDTLSCYGSPFTDTPNIDRLAADGVCLERAYCTNPVCTPARASIFTGKYVSRHGAWNVGMNIPEDEPMISHRLSEVGYRTHYIGKAHFQPFGASPENSIETRNNTERYPDFQGPYYGFETIELALGHATYGIAGH
ncbi:sulfatase-like hydrolase/transferase [Candidatus Poribacteria bacterium]|nr:sulfatase-like hydrolase/transferase [Candidatus Poribacteria bacterium]